MVKRCRQCSVSVAAARRQHLLYTNRSVLANGGASSDAKADKSERGRLERSRIRHEPKIATRRRLPIGVPWARPNDDCTFISQDIQHFTRSNAAASLYDSRVHYMVASYERSTRSVLPIEVGQ